jgi:hypothetical protein
MNTYQKQYAIKWLNMNPQQRKVEALYSVSILLDDGQKASLKDFSIVIDGQKFDELFSLPITALGQQTTLGEFLSYLTASAARIIDKTFPVADNEITKFGDDGLNLLQSN